VTRSSRITGAQETYLRRLLNEAFARRYDTTAALGVIERNRLGTLTGTEASRAIQHLVEARERGWTPWVSTPIG